MLKEVKPKTARAKRELERRAPQVVENPKTTLFLRGQNASQVVQWAMADLNALKQPLAVRFTKKNPIHPFEDASSLEFFSEKNDASLLVFGQHTKKRPHSLTLARTFNHKILDLLELYVIPETFRTLSQFKNAKCGVGLKPMISFSGTPFDSPVTTPYTVAKSVFTDFFRGQDASSVEVAALQYMIHFNAEDEPADGEPGPAIKMRVYRLVTKRSGQKTPLVELDEIGPRIDFRVGRVQPADESMMKEALKRPKQLEARTKKNVDMDIMGDKIGRIHVGKQEVNTLQTRKMKSLKRERIENAQAKADGTKSKKGRVSVGNEENATENMEAIAA